MADTLVIDSAQIVQWQAQPDFDYNRELAAGGMSFTDWLLLQLNHLLGDLFHVTWQSNYTWWLLTAVGAVAGGIAGWYVWHYHPGLFQRQGTIAPTAEAAAEDTIYGIDFDAAISRALGREDYREAVRMVYLQVLKALSDRHAIDWQPFKTPSQYVGEMSSHTASEAFRQLTRHFLLVRYGNFPATQQLYEQVNQLGKEVRRES